MSRLLTRISKRTRTYKDFDLKFTMNPLTKDVAAVLDEEAVKASVRNIVLYSRNEKAFSPMFGGDVYGLLFENWNPLVANAIAMNIKDEVRANEPRARDVQVELTDRSEDMNAIMITVYFMVANVNEPLTVTEFLYRTR
jgi:phage baseplate assembly protein W